MLRVNTEYKLSLLDLQLKNRKRKVIENLSRCFLLHIIRWKYYEAHKSFYSSLDPNDCYMNHTFKIEKIFYKLTINNYINN